MVTVVSTWPGTFSNTLNQPTPPPAATSCETAIANTGQVGNWLFAFAAWSNPGSGQTSVAVGDDSMVNVWQPLGAPVAATPITGDVRLSVWYCANPVPASIVYTSPNGYCPAIITEVIEVAGLPPWASVSALAPNFSNSASALDVDAPSPASQAIVFGLFAYNNHSRSLAGGGLANALTQVTVTNGGADTSNDLVLVPSWVVSAGPVSTTFQFSTGAAACAALLAGVLVNPAPPVPAASDWPYVQAHAAFGGGAATPWDALEFTDFTPRFAGLNTARGKQYELDAIQSGTGTWKLRNNDAALTPAYPSSPYNLGVTGWSVTAGFGSLTPAPLLTYSYFGQSAAVFTPDGITAGAQFSTVPQPVVPALFYTGTAHLFCPAGWVPGAAAQIIWYQADGLYLAAVTGAVTAMPNGQWMQVYVRGQAPAGAAYGSLAIQVQGIPLLSTRFWIAAAPLADATGQIVNTNPYFSQGPQVNTPVRALLTWPPPPALNARLYCVHRGFMQRWPNTLSNARYQYVTGQSVDAWALTTALLKTLPRAEILADQPYAWWPCDDIAGSTSAANFAPTTAGALQVVTSKFGPGSSVQQFGVSASAFAGDPSTSAWQVEGQTTLTQGYALYYSDPNLPPIGSNVSIEAWVNVPASQPAGNLGLLTISVPSINGASIWTQVYIQSSNGGMFLQTGPAILGSSVAGPVNNTVDYLGSGWIQLVLTLTSTSVNLYVNGVLAPISTTFPGIAPVPWFLSVAGVSTPYQTGNLCNAEVAHVAVYPSALPAARIMTHYLSMLTAMNGYDLAGQRIERLLSAGNAALPRVIPAGYDPVIGAIDIAGQACGQNVVNIAESDGSLLMCTAGGYIFSRPRRAGFNQPVSWVFGENPATPLNQNWSFPGTVSPWTGVNNATCTYSGLWSYGPPPNLGSAIMVPDGITASPGIQSENTIPVTAGTSYTGSGWVNCQNGWPAGGSFSINWYTSGSVLISNSAGTVITLGPGVPTQLEVTARAPANAAFAKLKFGMAGTPPASAFAYVAYAPLTTTATEYPYLQSVATGFDPTVTFNDLQLSQVGAPSLLTYAFSATVNTSLFFAAGSNLAAGDQVTLTGASLPSPFTTGVTYYVVNPVGATFQLASVAGGTPVTVTVNGSGTLTALAAASGVTSAFGSASSIGQVGDETLQQSTYLNSAATITDQGWWIVYTTTPQNRVPTLVLDPSANPALWPVVLGIETGQVVQVHRRLGGTQDELGGIFQVMSVSHQIGARTWQTTVALVPYPGRVLTCDDPVYGVLNAGNRLGW